MARFGMKQKEESGSSLHLRPGFLWQSSEGHEAMVEQNQAICTRQSAQEVTFSPRASAVVAVASCHLQMVSSGLPQEGELKKSMELRVCYPGQPNITREEFRGKGRPPKKQIESAALTVKDE